MHACRYRHKPLLAVREESFSETPPVSRSILAAQKEDVHPQFSRACKLSGAAPLHRFDEVKRLNGSRLALGSAAEQPANAIGAHVFDQRHQGLALGGQRVLDPGWNLGVGVALDDALLLESAEAEGEGAGADALQGALELAEAG